MLKDGIATENTRGVQYVVGPLGSKRPRPWAGSLLAFLYDRIMKRSFFPNMFGASYEAHQRFLRGELAALHDRAVLELATGSGNLAEALPPDNDYAGVDISDSLLRQARRKFARARQRSCALYCCAAEDLPFASESFDLVLCNLALNFFESAEKAVDEAARVMRRGASFIGSVPVPERNKLDRTFNGTLRSEKELRQLFESRGFEFSPYDERNGVLLYFKAIRRE